MRIMGRVRKLEAVIKPDECRACGDRIIGIMFDPPHPQGLPVVFAGRECEPAQCPKCGRWPRRVVTFPWNCPPALAARAEFDAGLSRQQRAARP